jgi:hypothetical protein
LSGRQPPTSGDSAATSKPSTVKEEKKEDPWAKLGSGTKLNTRTSAPATSSNRQTTTGRSDAIVIDDDDLMHDSDSEFNGFDEDDIIEIDSD